MPWLWMLPALLLLATFLVYPGIDTFRRSVLDARSDGFVGLDNYQAIIENPNPLVADTHSALANNAMWLVLFTAVTVPLGLVLAVLTGRVRYEAAAKSAIFIPMAISFVAASVIWRFMLEFNPSVGTVNAVVTEFGGQPTAWLQDTGAPQTWLTERGPDEIPGPVQLNNLVLITVGVWMWTGFALVVLSAGLKGISTEMLEAARVDGANEWQIFRHIIVPTLRPVIVVVTVTLLINALKIFDLVWVITGGRFQTDVVATLFFKQSFINRDFGAGAALAVVLLLAVVPLMLLNIRRFQSEEAA
ncbi:MAG: ABC transporter permease subunit [Dehalococcoidia bacterium]|nr:ABC transporter permease subunit [Dehalococcoidia bacterium]